MAGIKIDGREYELPELDGLTLGEARVVFHYTNRTLDKLDGAGFDPDLVAAIIHIAIMRENSSLSAAEIEERIQGLSLRELEEALGAQAEAAEAENPPDPPAPSNGTDGSGDRSGSASSPSSVPGRDDGKPDDTGRLRSVITAT